MAGASGPRPRPPLEPLTWLLWLPLLLGTCVRPQGTPALPEPATAFIPPAATRAPGTPPSREPEEALSPVAVDPTATSPGRATATAAPFLNDPSLPRSQYSLSVDFDYLWHRLHVFQALTYVNRTGENLTELVLLVEPNREPGVFELREITWADGRPVDDYDLDGALLVIPLDAPLRPWNSVGLSMAFRLDLPERAATLGHTPRQTNLGDWYPFVPLHEPGRGWLAHPPGQPGVGEFRTYELGDFQVEIRLVDPPDGLTLAASAPGVVDGDWHRYTTEAARNFSWSASTEYETAVDERGFVSVYGYFFPEHRAAGEAAVQASARALELYAELFGSLTHESLAVVEAGFPDGMEYDGLYFLSQGYYETYFGGAQNFLTTLAVHETAHQWWYGLVANDQAYEPWLDEAFATFSEWLYFQRFHPDLEDWWWEFRVGLYQPEGWVDSTIYDHAAFRPYVNAVYLRGVQFLRDARRQLGEEAFFKALRAYLIRNSFGQVTGDSFFGLLAEETGDDLKPLRAEYFQSGQ